MKLSEAIRKGCEIAPIKTTTDFIRIPTVFDPSLRACALGAAWLGIRPDEMTFIPANPTIVGMLHNEFPELLDYEFKDAIVFRNDGDHYGIDYTREEIADWLEAMGY